MTNKKKKPVKRKKSIVAIAPVQDIRIIVPAEVITDSRLGRRPQEDARNKDFPICSLLMREAYLKPKSKTWECKQVLDQGAEGSCVGHGFAHDLIARPYPLYRLKGPDAVKIYKKAQELDEWPGSSYSGTSVLAGAKATMELHPGAMESYRWCTTIQDVIATLGHFGPIVIGVNWYTGMYGIDANGYIKVTGSIAGGHCLLLRGVDIENLRLLLHNSWGPMWGRDGTAWISFQDFERLMKEGGDCCVPVNRKYWK